MGRYECYEGENVMRSVRTSPKTLQEERIRVAILISGRGSNMEALLEAASKDDSLADIACIISNKAQAKGIEIAREKGYPVYVFDTSKYPRRRNFEVALLDCLYEQNIHILCCAGFMRILSRYFLHTFSGVCLNIHPSLLPRFKGLNAVQQAIDAGVDKTGATVHYVDERVDEGKIIVQKAVDVHTHDTFEKLSERVLKIEHEIYPQALQKVCEEFKEKARRQA